MPVTKVRSQWAAGNLEFVAASDPTIKLGGFVNLLATATKAGGTLPVPITARFVTMVTGGAEALTLADGVPGQESTIIFGADSGDGTLTPTTKTGFSTIVFADVGDYAHLRFVDTTVGWIVMGSGGFSTHHATLA